MVGRMWAVGNGVGASKASMCMQFVKHNLKQVLGWPWIPPTSFWL